MGRAWRKANANRRASYRQENADRIAGQQRAARYRRRIAHHLLETEATYALWLRFNNEDDAAPMISAQTLAAHWSANAVLNTCRHGCGNGWREIVHVVPLHSGGRHDVTNLRPECGKPNCSPDGVGDAAIATDQRNT